MNDVMIWGVLIGFIAGLVFGALVVAGCAFAFRQAASARSQAAAAPPSFAELFQQQRQASQTYLQELLAAYGQDGEGPRSAHRAAAQADQVRTDEAPEASPDAAPQEDQGSV